jgi:anti-sigma B factor antagonist
MRIEQHEDTLHVSEVRELDSAHAAIVHKTVVESVSETVRHIEVDLSGTLFLDSCGLGTLVALRKLVGLRGGVVRLLNPTPAALQLLELTRLYRVLEVVKREEASAGANQKDDPHYGA